VLHPFLFALFPILFFYSQNKGELELSVVVKPILLSGILTLMVIFLFSFFLKRNLQKSSFATSFLLILFFSFGHILPSVRKLPMAEWLLLTFFVAVYAVLFVWIRKRNIKLNVANKFLSIVGAILLLNTLFSIARDYQSYKGEANLTSTEETLDTGRKDINPDDPDIYYIVLDRYANNATLKEEYNFDNSGFTDYLEQKDFFVSYESFANYPKTNLSLASTLNMKHITYLTEELGKSNSNTKIAFELLYNNEVVRFLKQRGYDFIYMGGWWGPTQKNDYADYNFNLFTGANEFNRELLKTTAVRPFVAEDKTKRQNIIYKFDKLVEMPSFGEKPKFIFVHMFMPHYPYLFDSDCESVKDTEGENENKRYLDQLKCTNKFVINTIDKILADSSKTPVIIIQSDEGPFKYDEMRRSGEGVDWTKASDKAVRVHMRILNAYYLPNTDYSTTQLYDGISPVNSFRALFNYYFDTNFDLLPDKSYFIPHLDFPYDYFEVTDKVEFK
jgi:hypothetical protein